MDKRLQVKLNANRIVTGYLRGYDQFMNIVLEETVEEVSGSERNPIGWTVGFARVCLPCIFCVWWAVFCHHRSLTGFDFPSPSVHRDPVGCSWKQYYYD
jgi:small nuclear ribonucleoprotein (snRNP)-like protein